MMIFDAKRIARLVIPLAAALISVFVLAKPAASTAFHAETIHALEEKKTTVMELTAASTAASAAITLIPGDVATPIAEKLADLSGYFLIVLCAIFLEKYLLTVTGYAAFVVVIPLACLLFSADAVLENGAVRQTARKLLIFGLAIFLVVPASVKISDMIETTYSASIHETIDSAKEATEEIRESAGNGEDKEEGFLSSIFSKVEDGVSSVTDRVKTVLSDFLEALAVMLVTSCVIPVVVLLFFVWLVKVLLGVPLPVFHGRP